MQSGEGLTITSEFMIEVEDTVYAVARDPPAEHHGLPESQMTLMQMPDD